jgi:hypothetical protein
MDKDGANKSAKKRTKWDSEQRDLNPRPTAPKAAALNQTALCSESVYALYFAKLLHFLGSFFRLDY